MSVYPVHNIQIKIPYSRKRTTVLEQSSHRRLVAVEEGTAYTILVYCDPYYEQVSYNYVVFIWNYYLGIVLHSDSLGALNF